MDNGKPDTNHKARQISRFGRYDIVDDKSGVFCDGRQQQQVCLAPCELRKNRAALKQLEIDGFTIGQDRIGETQKEIDELSRMIAESGNRSRPMRGSSAVRSATTFAALPM